MHELLTAVAAANPVAGNAEGSYVTMRSKSGLIFGVIVSYCILYRKVYICIHNPSQNIIGNFATVFQDQVRSSLRFINILALTVTIGLLAACHC